MEVRLYPNPSRPSVGLRPKREAQRPLLPQHARHCPVLEAGSSLGYLVYPPLTPDESFHVEYRGDGKYSFVFYAKNKSSGRTDALFQVLLKMPVGTAGMISEEVTFLTNPAVTDRANALAIMRTFIIVEDMGTPAGALALRGAWNFSTPQGWDTVYAPIFNLIERPIAPMMVVRVETDWYAHESEFRYVMEPGEGISGQHTLPIGQVFFVPREEITTRDCTKEEIETLKASRQEFLHHKGDDRLTTPYGYTYSPHYLKKSRESREATKSGKSE